MATPHVYDGFRDVDWGVILPMAYSPHRQVPGIYAIINRDNGKIYIGSAAVSITRRRNGHRCHLRYRRHNSIYLQRAFEKSPESFEFVIIEEMPGATKEEVLSREQFWMDFYKSYVPENGYNMAIKAGSCRGIKRRPEVAAKYAALLKSHRESDAYKIGLKRSAEARKGKAPTWMFTPEARKKQALALKGRKQPKQHIDAAIEGRRLAKVCWKPVVQVDELGKDLVQFERIKDAEEAFGVPFGKSNIRSVCNGVRPRAYGYKWRWA